jgi:hypothetical protein
MFSLVIHEHIPVAVAFLFHQMTQQNTTAVAASAAAAMMGRITLVVVVADLQWIDQWHTLKFLNFKL